MGSFLKHYESYHFKTSIHDSILSLKQEQARIIDSGPPSGSQHIVVTYNACIMSVYFGCFFLAMLGSSDITDW